jgi:hypothetical protein
MSYDVYTMPPELLEKLLQGHKIGPQEQEQLRMLEMAESLRNQGVAPGDHGMQVGGQWMPNYGGLAQRGMGAYHGDKMQKKATAMGPQIAEQDAALQRSLFEARTQPRPQQVTADPNIGWTPM